LDEPVFRRSSLETGHSKRKMIYIKRVREPSGNCVGAPSPFPNQSKSHQQPPTLPTVSTP
jgi:hypothetical protein